MSSTLTAIDFKVADLSLADWGRKEITIAESEMPALMASCLAVWRAVRGEDYEWVKPHTLRKTAGTMVAHAMGVEAAAAMLGHSSTAITERHYIERARIAPDSSAALDALG